MTNSCTGRPLPARADSLLKAQLQGEWALASTHSIALAKYSKSFQKIFHRHMKEHQSQLHNVLQSFFNIKHSTLLLLRIPRVLESTKIKTETFHIERKKEKNIYFYVCCYLLVTHSLGSSSATPSPLSTPVTSIIIQIFLIQNYQTT